MRMAEEIAEDMYRLLKLFDQSVRNPWHSKCQELLEEWDRYVDLTGSHALTEEPPERELPGDEP